jgi:hypothetical protein
MSMQHNPALQNGSAPASTPAGGSEPDPEKLKKQRRIVFGIIAGVVLFLVLLVVLVVFLAQDAGRTAVIRDIVIIFMALESLLLGLTLVILIAQLARLINLLQNEIKPILDSTNETVNTMRGTVTFLSDNLAEPVVKVNEYFAAFSEVGKFFRSIRGK